MRDDTCNDILHASYLENVRLSKNIRLFEPGKRDICYHHF